MQEQNQDAQMLKQSSANEELLETLFLVIKCALNVHDGRCNINEHKVCSVTREPSRSSRRCVSLFKGTVMQTEKALINYHLCVLNLS